MQPYNIEVFDRDFNLIQHYVIENVDYKYDYLSITENTITIPYDSSVDIGDYIRLKNDEHEYKGVITSLSIDNSIDGFTNIGFKPLINLFNYEIMFTVSDQGTDTLENILADYITAYFINNADDEQNISGLSVSTLSSTSTWTFNLSEEVEGTGLVIVNLYELLRLALINYGVAIYFDVDYDTGAIDCSIGTLSSGTFYIEADLPSVIDKSIIVNQSKSDINKLVIYDKSDLTTSVTYYLHSDDTYDTSDSDRISPVIYDIQTASSTTDKTFAEVAAEVADAQFGNNKRSNLIELTILSDDTMVNPSDLYIGQEVSVITNGTAYASIFTGYEISDVTKLIFGTIRLDLTKILKEVI